MRKQKTHSHSRALPDSLDTPDKDVHLVYPLGLLITLLNLLHAYIKYILQLGITTKYFLAQRTPLLDPTNTIPTYFYLPTYIHYLPTYVLLHVYYLRTTYLPRQSVNKNL